MISPEKSLTWSSLCSSWLELVKVHILLMRNIGIMQKAVTPEVLSSRKANLWEDISDVAWHKYNNNRVEHTCARGHPASAHFPLFHFETHLSPFVPG